MGVGISEKQNKIATKIYEIYIMYGKYCQTKEEFREKIRSSLTTEQLKYFYEEDIQEYFNAQLNYIWKKLQDDKIEKVNPYILKEIQKKYDESISELIIKHQKEIFEATNKIKAEQEEKFLKSQEKFQKTCNEFQNTIKIMEMSAEKERENMRKKQKEMEENLSKQIKQLEKRYQEERDEEKKKKIEKKKKKLEEHNKKVQNINKLYNEKVNNFKNNKIDELVESFKLSEDKFCEKEISSIHKTKITSFIKDFFINEQIPQLIVDQLKAKINTVIHKIKNIEHLNIILVGPSGVGKSTLINGIFNEKKSETGFGKVQTKNIQIMNQIIYHF